MLFCSARKALKGPGYLEQCPNKKKENSHFCGKHQACKTPFIAALPLPLPLPIPPPMSIRVAPPTYQNTTDFYNLEPIENIPQVYFYTLVENNFFYAFDITTLHDYLTQQGSEGNHKNPYTNVPIPIETVATIKKAYAALQQQGVAVDRYKEEVQMSPHKKLKWRCLSIFQHINHLGHYSDFNWFWQLTLPMLVDMYDGLSDLWFYRVFLSQEQKKEILANYVSFTIVTLEQFSHLTSINLARSIMLNEIDKFVTLGTNRDHQYTGSILVLTALIEVSPQAAEHMPHLISDDNYS